MFFVRLDLAERLVTADRLKDRIIAEALRPARRPDDQSVYAAFKAFDMAVGPGQRQRADEMGVMPGVRPRPFHRFMHQPHGHAEVRSEEHTSELQSLMRISYAVFCLKKKKYDSTISLNIS